MSAIRAARSMTASRATTRAALAAALVSSTTLAQSVRESAAPGGADVDASPETEPRPDDATDGRSNPRADDARPVFELDPILVTPTRSARRLLDVPAIGNVVTSEDIDDALSRTVPEALREVPGVMVQRTGHGQGSPFIRGFTGFRTLMLIDGVRLNNSVFRDGPNQYWNTIDPYSIDRMEVVKGPSSVLYGSDAIGGTVSVFSKGPNTYGAGFAAGGRAFYRGATAERSNTLRGELSLSWDETVGAWAGGTLRRFGDLESGGGRQPMTGYDEYDADFKVESFVNPDTRFVVAHQRVTVDDAWRTHRTVFGRSFEGTTVGNEQRRVLDQRRRLTYVQFHAERIDSFIDVARLNLSYHVQEEDRDRVRSDGRRDEQGFDVGSLGGWAQFESDSPIGRWTYGVEGYRDDVNSYRRDFAADGSFTADRVQGPVADDATYDLVGVYVQNQSTIAGALDVILGARYTYARADARNVADPSTGDTIRIADDFDDLVGSARLVWRLGDRTADMQWNVFGGISQGFRAPNLSDLTRFDTARSNEIEIPSPGLDPERFISYEVGLKASGDTLFAQASWYYTDIDDLIIRQPTGDVIGGDEVVAKRNGGAGFVQGIELQGSWTFAPGWRTFGSFAWIEGEADVFPTSDPVLVREPLSRLMPMTGQLGIRWDSADRTFWCEAVATVAARQDKLSSRDLADTQRIPPGGTPGYAVLSMRGGWRVGHGVSLTAAIENVGDVNYRVHGSGVNEAGLNLVFGLDYRF